MRDAVSNLRRSSISMLTAEFFIFNFLFPVFALKRIHVAYGL